MSSPSAAAGEGGPKKEDSIVSFVGFGATQNANQL